MQASTITTFATSLDLPAQHRYKEEDGYGIISESIPQTGDNFAYIMTEDYEATKFKVDTAPHTSDLFQFGVMLGHIKADYEEVDVRIDAEQKRASTHIGQLMGFKVAAQQALDSVDHALEIKDKELENECKARRASLKVAAEKEKAMYRNTIRVVDDETDRIEKKSKASILPAQAHKKIFNHGVEMVKLAARGGCAGMVVETMLAKHKQYIKAWKEAKDQRSLDILKDVILGHENERTN